MTTALPNRPPAVLLEEANELGNLHRFSLYGGRVGFINRRCKDFVDQLVATIEFNAGAPIPTPERVNGETLVRFGGLRIGDRSS